MRLARWIAFAIGLVVGLPLLGLAVIVVVANTAPGRHLIEDLAPKVSGGMVAIDGLSGRFPDALRIGRITVRDKDGVWLTIDQARLDWSPLRLLAGEIKAETLAATHVTAARLPESAPSSAGGGETTLPLRVTVGDFHVDRLDLAAPIAGVAVGVRVDGTLHLASLEQGTAAFNAERIDGPGSYKLSATLAPDSLAARIDVAEPSHGLVAGLAGLSDDLGALSISARLEGPRSAEQAQFTLTAGPLAAQGQGTINLVGKILDIDLTASAPAMAPRPDLGWQSARLDAHIHGPFTGPNASGHLDIERLKAGDSTVERLTGDIQGNSGTVGVTASLAGLRVPGPQPGLFAAAPFEVHADATLNTPQRPVSFTLSHPLVTMSGAIDTGGVPAGSVTVTLPSLAPLAATAAIDLRGSATLTAKLAQQDSTTRVGVDGTIGITGGFAPTTALLGGNATLAMSATLRGQEVALDNVAITGKAVQVSAKGSDKGGVADIDWKLALSDLSALAPALAGNLSAQGHVQGPPTNLAITAQATGAVATAGFPAEPLTLSLQAQGLPDSPAGRLEAQGRFAGAPLQLAAAVTRQSDGTLDIGLDRLQWKSASGDGKLTLAPGALVPLGHLQLRLARLDDLSALTGVAASGSIDATLDTVQVQGRPQARIRADMQRLALSGAGVDRLTVDAQIADPVAHPVLALTAAASGFRQGRMTGNARLTANGPQEALALTLASDVRTPQGPAKLAAAATARLPQRVLELASLQADYGGETARLLAPARIALADGVSVDRLRLGVGGATIAVAGRITPTLALTVSAQNITPALAKPFVPEFAAVGTMALDGQLRGTLAAPEGTLRLTGRGLRVTSGNIAGLPAADLDATATLARSAAQLDARLAAGAAIQLRLAGTVPLQPAAAIALRLTGTTDLKMLDPLLTPNGRTARGDVTVDLGVAGTLGAPRATGSVHLAHGSIEDFVQGIHLTGLTGLVQADGDALRIVQLTGQAAPGTLSVAGTVGVLEPEIPVSLTVTMRNARPLASDLLTATINADLTVGGQLLKALSFGGRIHVVRADVNIPDRLPQGVATLKIRRPGAKPPPAAPVSNPVALDLTIAAPEQVFVRGHGVDAEMGGTLKIGGDTAAPTINGGFDLRHGTFSLAGQTLNFTSGRVAFGGSGLANKLDPTIYFVAQSTANAVTATLTVTGYADAPKIALSSTPDLPQDEILGQILFGQGVKRLNAFQLAEVAQAVAALGGVGGSNPLATLRSSLGLDRLSVSGTAGTRTGATVEAGKYVAKGVYVGAKQGSSGGSQAQVQIDLTRHLKLQSTLGTGGTPVTGVTPNNDPGSSLGLSYQLEY